MHMSVVVGLLLVIYTMKVCYGSNSDYYNDARYTLSPRDAELQKSRWTRRFRRLEGQIHGLERVREWDKEEKKKLKVFLIDALTHLLDETRKVT